LPEPLLDPAQRLKQIKDKILVRQGTFAIELKSPAEALF
jgi:hypothetical protein